MNFDIDKIINDIPKNLTDIERIRYIYLKCGELFSYNRDYLYTYSYEDGKKLYDQPFDWNFVKNRKGNTRISATCKQIATACTDAINRLFENTNNGLSNEENTDRKNFARNIGYVPGEEYHVATLVYLNNEIYFLDLYKDLYRIQKGLKTKYFAPEDKFLEKEKTSYPLIKKELDGMHCKSFSESEIMDMDKKCGYNANGIYMDDAIDFLKREMADKEKIKQFLNDYDGDNKNDAIYEWKLNFICKYLMTIGKDQNINEMTKYFLKLYYSIMTEQEKRESIFTPIDIHYKGKPSILIDIDRKSRVNAIFI